MIPNCSCGTAATGQAAFTGVVRRHLSLVYFAAMRQTGGDPHLAQDVSQAVFSSLALKAPQLAHRVSIAGWLYTCSRYIGARLAARRAATAASAGGGTDWKAGAVSAVAIAMNQMGPVLDEALGAAQRDRELVLLRYFQDHTFAQISAKLSLSADAARFRLERALGKMRARLARRGIESTLTALELALASQAQAAVSCAGRLGHGDRRLGGHLDIDGGCRAP